MLEGVWNNWFVWAGLWYISDRNWVEMDKSYMSANGSTSIKHLCGLRAIPCSCIVIYTHMALVLSEPKEPANERIIL